MDFGVMMGAVLGTLGSLLVATVFHVVAMRNSRAATRSLQREIDRLHKVVEVVARALESAEMIELNRDAEGNISGVVHHARATLTAQSYFGGDLTVRRKSGQED
jgi:type II secretory pathway component PulJ